MTTEKRLENRLREAVKKAGGLCLKLHPFTFTGLPDRLVLLPGGRIAFVELKSADRGTLTARQKLVIGQLRALGFDARTVWNDQDYERLKIDYVI